MNEIFISDLPSTNNSDVISNYLLATENMKNSSEEDIFENEILLEEAIKDALKIGFSSFQLILFKTSNVVKNTLSQINI